MSNVELDGLRARLDEINEQLLELISERAQVVQEIGVVKEKQGVPKFDPEREKQMLEKLVAGNKGPFTSGTIRSLFKQIFSASLDLQSAEHKKSMLVSRKSHKEDTVIVLPGDVTVGGLSSLMVAGPCSVESELQTRTVAAALKRPVSA